ncbi:hypothetical protein JYU34_005219 [Plutella xylostella]|uniref:Cysteine sulfinic acid decarboxylase n=1 Tax=Plutella xylostella TaxID=51655 RepID=A0ABQ7QW66_PLUXY|nr:hypothetical protein JYU34_005219 [Plutella xylostella]
MNNGHTFLNKVLSIIKEETEDNVPLIQFKHPEDLEKILDLSVLDGVPDDRLETIVRQVLQYSVKTGKPTFRNQLYGGTDPYSLAGAVIAEAFNTSQYTFEVAPAFTLIELEIIRHVLHLFGIPHGDGIFSPGGSVSMLYAIVQARFQRFPQVKREGMWGLPRMMIFTSEDSHYSVLKAAHWLGFGTESVRMIKTNPQGQMLVEELDKAIQEEVALGRCPLMVNATAGTTVLGAIDDLTAVSEVCKRHGVWMHVDGCWGGSLILSEKYRHMLAGIERANSISWNPHKMAGAVLQCSLFLVRRPALHEANCAAATYLFQQDKFYTVRYDTGDKSVQCGRKTDAFKLWVMWKARGDAGLGSLVDRTMHIAQHCLRAVSSRPGFRVVSQPLMCPNVCFWYIPAFMRGKEEDEKWWGLMHKITPKIKELLTLSARLMVAYTPLRQHKNFFRLAFTCHPEVTTEHVADMLEAIEECGEMVTLDMLQ